MRNYELMLVIRPTVEEEIRDAQLETVKEIIATDGEVVEVDIWGMKRLAYEIEKHKEGFYVVIQFKAGVELPKELDRRLKISDNVIRHIIINKDEK